MKNWLNSHQLANISAFDLLIFLIISTVIFLIIVTLWKFVVHKLSAYSAKTENVIDNAIVEVLSSTSKLTFVIFSVLIGVRYIDLPLKWTDILGHVTYIVIGVQLAVWCTKVVKFWANNHATKNDYNEHNIVINSIFSWALITFVWAILLLFSLDNFGVNITALVASLGIGGIAIALAMQTILGDLIASLSIGLDKPFEIGDYIVFGNVAGNVEKVGLKTTHIRSLNGEQIICSNTEILKNTIQNFKRMDKRRVVLKFGVSYATDPNLLIKISNLIKQIIEGIDKTRFERAHFNNFASCTLDYEVVYHIDNADFGLYMDIQQTVNIELMKGLKTLEVKFSIPTTRDV